MIYKEAVSFTSAILHNATKLAILFKSENTSLKVINQKSWISQTRKLTTVLCHFQLQRQKTHERYFRL